MTGTFHFRLEILLRLRVAERDQRRAELAKAIRAEEMLEGERRALLQQELEAEERGRQLKSPGAADVDGLLQTHRYAVVLAAQRAKLTAQIAQVQGESERSRQALVEANRQVRVLEMLRERQAAAHAHQMDRWEAKQFDEQANQAYVRYHQAFAHEEASP